MTALRIRAPLACRIAGVDRDRFNEAVARGDYPCAPLADAGRTRLFHIHEVVALFVYGRLVARGMPTREAGHLACEIGSQARLIEAHEDELCVTVVETMHMRHVCVSTITTPEQSVTPERRDALSRETRALIISPAAHSMTDGAILRQEHWQIGNIRKVIDRAIEDYRNTLGEEEIG